MHTSGCAHHAPTITVGPGPGPPALDSATRTVYVPFGTAANKVAVVNAATCNAQDSSGLRADPGSSQGRGRARSSWRLAPRLTLSTRRATGAPALQRPHCRSDQRRGLQMQPTIPAAVTLPPPSRSGGSLSASPSMTGPTPSTWPITPLGEDPRARSRSSTARPATAPTPRAVRATCPPPRSAGRPTTSAVDRRTDIMYITDENSAAVSVLHGAKCRAGMTRGCRGAVTQQAVSSIPIGVSVNSRNQQRLRDASLPAGLSINLFQDHLDPLRVSGSPLFGDEIMIGSSKRIHSISPFEPRNDQYDPDDDGWRDQVATLYADLDAQVRHGTRAGVRSRAPKARSTS